MEYNLITLIRKEGRIDVYAKPYDNGDIHIPEDLLGSITPPSQYWGMAAFTSNVPLISSFMEEIIMAMNEVERDGRAEM